MIRNAKLLAAAIAAAVTLAAPAQAQKSADTLRAVHWTQIADINPYYNQLRDGLVVAHQAWDGLVYRDPETFAIKPLLATAWKYVDDTTLEFQLRKGVKFHDGSPFSADDVVYTFNSILTDKLVSTPSNYAWMEGAEKVDDFTVRVKLKRVFPAAMENLAMVMPILPKAYREKMGAEGYSKAPIGAGPYRFTKVETPSQFEFERFDDYYADSPKPKPAIRRLVLREVSDATTALNELIGGKADWTWNFIPDNFDNVARLPTLNAVRGGAMRVYYIGFDSAGRTGANNPLTNPKVRQAIAHAVNRGDMAKNLMQGDSKVLDTPCYPTQFGCDATVAVRYEFNPAKARALLAEAGYPNGFETELLTFVPPQFGVATQNYLRDVGISVKVSQLQVQAVIQRMIEGNAPMVLSNWGSYSVNDISAFLPAFINGGNQDYIRNADLQKLVDQGGASTNPDERRKNYSAAIKTITEQMLYLPLFNSVVTYGMSKQINFKPYPDELPRFYLSTWK
ncbi:MAG: ABC transporter substrate-binding protein [Alphaproteobacteria bacterium]|nr:ABC transporter substrate-binding protein [Alphaproteobacteria bacterium]